jgi:hypothetical protein
MIDNVERTTSIAHQYVVDDAQLVTRQRWGSTNAAELLGSQAADDGSSVWLQLNWIRSETQPTRWRTRSRLVRLHWPPTLKRAIGKPVDAFESPTPTLVALVSAIVERSLKIEVVPPLLQTR